MSGTEADGGEVPAALLRPLLGVRVRLFDGVTLDESEAVALVPRRGQVERLVARLIHRGEPRIRLRLDARALETLGTIAALGAPPVPELASRLGVAVPAPAAPGSSWGPDLVALLVFLEALVRGRVLVTEPI